MEDAFPSEVWVGRVVMVAVVMVEGAGEEKWEG